MAKVRAKYYVVEHESRGVLVERPTPFLKPRFSWSILRTDGIHFHSLQSAAEVLAKVNGLVKGKKAYIINMFDGKIIRARDIQLVQVKS